MVYSDVFGILFSQCGEISKMTHAATQVEGEVISAIDQLAWHDMARRPYCLTTSGRHGLDGLDTPREVLI